jgi:hypothetical protein
MSIVDAIISSMQPDFDSAHADANVVEDLKWKIEERVEWLMQGSRSILRERGSTWSGGAQGKSQQPALPRSVSGALEERQQVVLGADD